MITALTYVGVSVFVLLVLIFVYALEDRKGGRVIFPKMRESLDILFFHVLAFLSRCTAFFTHGFMRLLLHYSAHKILKRILSFLQHLEQKVEHLVRHNRKIAKTIKEEVKGKGHLQAIAEHKEEVALSEEQKQDMRSH